MRESRALFRVGLALVATIALATSCGDSSAEVSSGEDPAGSSTTSQVDGVYPGFRVIGEDEEGLNGSENEGRPPIRYLLLADAAGSATEVEMVDRYVEQLSADGWDMQPWTEVDDWWTAEGNDGVAFVRVGPASRFHELAKITEGYSRTRFRELAAENPEPLIVVSIDPSG